MNMNIKNITMITLMKNENENMKHYCPTLSIQPLSGFMDALLCYEILH